MTVTPHHIGQIAKAQILVAHLLDTAPAEATTERQAVVIVDQLQTDLGWSPPHDLTERPPTRPDRIATDDERRAHLAVINAELAAARRRRTTVTEESTQ